MHYSMGEFNRRVSLGSDATPVAKGGVKPLYVQRKLVLPGEFIAHFKKCGFNKVLDPSELHVTIAYSKTPVDWDLIVPDNNGIIVRGGIREIAPLGSEGAVVMKFTSTYLVNRWRSILFKGASWDYEGYTPHVTITYKSQIPVADLRKLPPFLGDLKFGGEIFEPINEGYAANVVEKRYT